jgi:tetratricopeptide (TPR) repeat protein
LSRSLETAESLGEHRLEVLVLAFITLALADLGDDDEAYRYAQRVQDAAGHVDELQMAAWVHRCMGYYHLRREEWEEALSYFLKDHEIMGPTQAVSRHYTTLYRASILVTLNQIEEAADLINPVVLVAKETQVSFLQGQAHAVVARVAAARGDTVAAEAAFNEATGVLEEIGSLLELGRAYLHRGLWAEGGGRIDQAREDLLRAQNIFESCAAARDLKKATAALSRLA